MAKRGWKPQILTLTKLDSNPLHSCYCYVNLLKSVSFHEPVSLCIYIYIQCRKQTVKGNTQGVLKLRLRSSTWSLPPHSTGQSKPQAVYTLERETNSASSWEEWGTLAIVYSTPPKTILPPLPSPPSFFFPT